MDFMTEPVLQVFLFALITAIATGLGAPIFYIEEMRRKWLGFAAGAITLSVVLMLILQILI